MARKDQLVLTLGLILGIIVFLVLGGVVTAMNLTPWYQTIALPSYTPPGGVFMVVWTVLYALLAAAIGLTWRVTNKDFLGSLGPLYLVNAGLNSLWSFVFFGLHDLTAAAVTAGLLACSVLILILANIKISNLAAALLVPYLLWVGFATVLNAHIAYLNQPVAESHNTLPMPKDRAVLEGIPDAITFTLAVGSTKKIDSHLTLTLRAVNDSRCPADEGVYCVWQGELSPQLTATLDGKATDVRLGTVTAIEADVGDYRLTLVDTGLESAKIKVNLP